MNAGATQFSNLSELLVEQSPDGARIYVELSFAVVLDARGDVLGVTARTRHY